MFVLFNIHGLLWTSSQFIFQQEEGECLSIKQFSFNFPLTYISIFELLRSYVF